MVGIFYFCSKTFGAVLLSKSMKNWFEYFKPLPKYHFEPLDNVWCWPQLANTTSLGGWMITTTITLPSHDGQIQIFLIEVIEYLVKELALCALQSRLVIQWEVDAIKALSTLAVFAVHRRVFATCGHANHWCTLCNNRHTAGTTAGATDL